MTPTGAGMVRDWLPRDGANRVLEPLLGLAVLTGFAYSIWFVCTERFLPQPFYHNTWDIWMDWFNPAFYAHNPGAYDEWQTLYPPVSFLFLRFTTLGQCYQNSASFMSEGMAARDCDWLGLAVMHGVFLVNLVLAAKILLLNDRPTALWRSLAVAISMPMLSGLERGNLTLLTTTFFMLAHGRLLKTARMRWLFLALSINFKVYLLPTLFAHLLRRRWRWFEGATIATALVWLVSWAAYGSGTPIEVYMNVVNWATNRPIWSNTLMDAWYSTTYQPMLDLLNDSTVPLMAFLGSDRLEFMTGIIPILLHSTQGIILLALAATWLRPEVVPLFRIVNLCMLLGMITSEPGSYAQQMFLLLTFMERWRGLGAKCAIVASYILAIPGDILLFPMYSLQNEGMVNAGPVFKDYWIAVGPFVRPLFVMIIASALSCATLKAVWTDVRTQGWLSRWRFRHDLPLLVQGGRVTGERAPASA